MELINSKIKDDAELIARVNRIVALTLGAGYQKAIEECFDERMAEQCLAFFAGESIPKVNPATLPSEVSGVQFKVDLSGVKPLRSAYLRTAGELFRAALRR